MVGEVRGDSHEFDLRPASLFASVQGCLLLVIVSQLGARTHMEQRWRCHPRRPIIEIGEMVFTDLYPKVHWFSRQCMRWQFMQLKSTGAKMQSCFTSVTAANSSDRNVARRAPTGARKLQIPLECHSFAGFSVGNHGMLCRRQLEGDITNVGRLLTLRNLSKHAEYIIGPAYYIAALFFGHRVYALILPPQ